MLWAVASDMESANAAVRGCRLLSRAKMKNVSLRT